VATHDYVIANGTGASVRSDLNDALAAIVSQNSSATAPATTYAYMWWADTANDLLKIRNAANSAWVTVGTLSAANLGLVPSTQTASTSAAGIVQLSTSTSSTSTTFAATPSAVKTAYDLANAALPKSGGTMTGDLVTVSLNGGQLAGMRNRIINGGMAVDQRNAGASQTFTAAAALAYSVDRWYGYCTGANVTGQRITGASAGQYRYRFTGAASVTGIGFGQRIEQLNSADLAGTTATLSVDLANSVLTTVTWTAYYATTADTFGTLASPTRTQIATGTFTVNSTVTRYSTNISIPAAATTGIEIVFTVGAQTSGTWTIGNVQLESGTVATPFERRSYGQELSLCQRYYSKSFPVASGIPSAPYYDGNMGWGQSIEAAAVSVSARFPVEMRATPTVTIYSPTSLTAGTFRVWQASVDRNGSAGQISATGFARIDKSGAADLSPSSTQNSAIHWIASVEL